METLHPLMQITSENLNPDPDIVAQMSQLPEAMDDEVRQTYRTSLVTTEILRQRAEAEPDDEALVSMHRAVKAELRQQQDMYGIFETPRQAPQDHPR